MLLFSCQIYLEPDVLRSHRSTINKIGQNSGHTRSPQRRSSPITKWPASTWQKSNEQFWHSKTRLESSKPFLPTYLYRNSEGETTQYRPSGPAISISMSEDSSALSDKYGEMCPSIHTTSDSSASSTENDWRPFQAKQDTLSHTYIHTCWESRGEALRHYKFIEEQVYDNARSHRVDLTSSNLNVRELLLSSWERVASPKKHYLAWEANVFNLCIKVTHDSVNSKCNSNWSLMEHAFVFPRK